ncbi:hypothetical protein J6P59_02665, partial [bacterium]|nr:hypothetical protein [bacterium]
MTKNLEEQDNELFRQRCKKDLNLLVLRKKLLYITNKKFVLKEDAIMTIKKRNMFFLLDEFLHINKNQHISEDDKQCAYELIALHKMTFTQVIKSLNHSISNSALSRIIRKQESNYLIKFSEPTTKYKYIYIDMDDTFTTPKINNKSVKFRNRVLHIYQDRDPKTK